MEKTFQNRSLALALEAIEFIKSKVIGSLSLIDRQDKDDDGNEFDLDDLQSLPIFSYITKHNYYLQYAIISLKNIDGRIKCVGKELGEEGDFYEISLEEITNEETFDLADHIATL